MHTSAGSSPAAVPGREQPWLPAQPELLGKGSALGSAPRWAERVCAQLQAPLPSCTVLTPGLCASKHAAGTTSGAPTWLVLPRATFL